MVQSFKKHSQMVKEGRARHVKPSTRKRFKRFSSNYKDWRTSIRLQAKVLEVLLGDPSQHARHQCLPCLRSVTISGNSITLFKDSDVKGGRRSTTGWHGERRTLTRRRLALSRREGTRMLVATRPRFHRSNAARTSSTILLVLSVQGVSFVLLLSLMTKM